MAVLKNLRNGQRIALSAAHTFGRARDGVSTTLTNPDASQIHAQFRWCGNHWKLIDYSRNGTWVNGKRIQKHHETTVEKGQTVRFGFDAEASWMIESDTEPMAVLIPDNPDSEVVPLTNLLVLPNEENPKYCLLRTSKGDWLLETEEQTKAIMDADKLLIDDEEWTVHLPNRYDETLNFEETKLPSFLLEFDVSQNEEHVFLRLTRGGEEYDFQERTHHYLLLLLARKHIMDSSINRPAERGWIRIEHVIKMLGINESHLNIQIYRIRKQFIQVLGEENEMTPLIERRLGEIRLGYHHFIIRKAGVIEAASGEQTKEENTF